MKIWVLLLLVVIISGCTSSAISSGVSLSVRADPSRIFLGTPTTIFIDVDNRDSKSIENVFVSVFDTGLLQGPECSTEFARMTPMEFRSVRSFDGKTGCIFFAPTPQELRESTQTEVSTLVTFDTTFSAVQLADVITQDEYQRRVETNDYRSMPTKYSYSDRNVKVDVEFSENPPLVMAPGKKYFIYFTVTNIGNGFIREIREDDFRVLSNGLLECPPRGTLEPDGKTFPKIACEIKIPDSFLRGQPYASTQFVIDFFYSYELRNTISVSLVK